MWHHFYSSEILLVNNVAPPINIPIPKIKKPLNIAKRLPKDKKIENKLRSVFFICDTPFKQTLSQDLSRQEETRFHLVSKNQNQKPNLIKN